MSDDKSSNQSFARGTVRAGINGDQVSIRIPGGTTHINTAKALGEWLRQVTESDAEREFHNLGDVVEIRRLHAAIDLAVGWLKQAEPTGRFRPELQALVDCADGAPAQSETKPTRDADHCDFPDCEQHNSYLLKLAVDAMEQDHAGFGTRFQSGCPQCAALRIIRGAVKAGAEHD